MRRIVSGLSAFTLVLVGSAAQAEVKQPQRIIDRPLSTPGGQLTVGADLGVLSVKLLEERTTSIALAPVAFYGVDDKLEVYGAYGFTLDEFEAKGTLIVGGAYGILQSGDLLVTANAQLGYNLLAEGLAPLNAGARIQYVLNKQMDLHSGGNQLTVTLDGDTKPIFLSLPIGFGYQANDAIYAFVDTSIGNIKISDTESAFLFADFIPLKIGAFFSPSNTLDIGAAIDFLDLKEAGADFITITASARLHM